MDLITGNLLPCMNAGEVNFPDFDSIKLHFSIILIDMDIHQQIHNIYKKSIWYKA